MNEEDHERDCATQVGGLFKEVGHEVGEGAARLMELMGGVRIWALRSMKKVKKRSELWIHGHVLHKYSEPRNLLRLHCQRERERERERERDY